MYCHYKSLWLFLTVPWVGLQYVIEVFPDHPQLLLDILTDKKINSWSSQVTNYKPNLGSSYENVVWGLLNINIPTANKKYIYLNSGSISCMQSILSLLHMRKQLIYIIYTIKHVYISRSKIDKQKS